MRFISSFLIICLSLFFLSCDSNKNNIELLRVYQAKKSDPQRVKVGLILGSAGLGDQSFNDMQYNGLIKAYLKHNIDVMFRVPKSYQKKELQLVFRGLINKGCRLIFAAEAYAMSSTVINFAKKHPKVTFVLMDWGKIGLPNVVSTEFAQNEGAFVVGVLAARMSKTKKVALIGGVDIAVVKDFLVGFRQGVRYADSSVTFLFKYVTKAPDFSGFSSPQKGYKLAKRFFAQGVDVIFSVAGGTGNGVIFAAKEQKKFVIGVDSNQDHMARGYVLTSMLKRLDKVMVDLVSRYINKKLRGGRVYRFDYRRAGIGITKMEYTKDKISKRIRDELKRVEKLIASGRIKVNSALGKGGN